MPAMTVNDLTVLPRVAAPAAGSTAAPGGVHHQRPVLLRG